MENHEGKTDLQEGVELYDIAFTLGYYGSCSFHESTNDCNQAPRCLQARLSYHKRPYRLGRDLQSPLSPAFSALGKRVSNGTQGTKASETSSQVARVFDGTDSEVTRL